MEIRYCERWSLFYKEAHKYISEDEACKRHAERKSYTAIIVENDVEKYIINVAGAWVSVYFLDKYKRNYLYYSFKEVEKNKLFLNFTPISYFFQVLLNINLFYFPKV